MLRTAKGFAVLAPPQESSDPFSSSTPVPLGNFLLLLWSCCTLLLPFPFLSSTFCHTPAGNWLKGKTESWNCFKSFSPEPRDTRGLIHILLTCLQLSLNSSKLSVERHRTACGSLSPKKTHTIPNPIITMTFDALACETNVLPLPTLVKSRKL